MSVKAIGGSDVCITCAAHSLVITEDLEPRIAELKAALVGMMNDYSSEGCADPDCGMCRRSKAAIKAAESALAKAAT